MDYGLVYNPRQVKQFPQVATFDCAKREALMMYADADFAGETETRKRTTGYIKEQVTTGYIMFFYGCPVIWKSGLQTMVATSTPEEEFIAAATTV
jgi:hypothetical protein